MSGMVIALDILGTHFQSFSGILLLRTVAIYSGSKLVVIPLSIAYVVRPQHSFTGLRGSPYAQAVVVSGIAINGYYLTRPRK